MDVATLKEHARELEQRGSIREALAMYRHALTSLEGTPELLGELPLYVKAGDLYLKLDNPKAAVSLYETAGKIYAAHGSWKSVNAICARVVGAMPARTHVYTRLVRIMLEHGHVAAARAVLLSYAEHVSLHDTRARLEQLADRTDEHLHPVLEMLVELAERLERAGVSAEARAPSARVEIPGPDVLDESAETGRVEALMPPAAAAGETDASAEEEEEREGLDEGPDDDATAAAMASDVDEETSESENQELTPAEPPDDDALDRDPFGLGLVLADLASEIESLPSLMPPGEGEQDAPSTDAILLTDALSPPPWRDFGPLVTHAEGEPEEPGSPHAAPHAESLPLDRSATPIPPDARVGAAPVEPSPPAPGSTRRTGVPGNGADWDESPGWSGRTVRRRSPVGSVLLAATERVKRRSRTPIYVGAGALVVLAVLVILWLLLRSGGGAEASTSDLLANPLSAASDMYDVLAAVLPPSAAPGEVPLALGPGPGRTADSLAVRQRDRDLAGGVVVVRSPAWSSHS